MSLQDSKTVVACRLFSDVAALVLVLHGLLVLCGWWLSIGALRSLVPGLVPMNPATAVAFMLSAVTLWQINPGRRGARKRPLALACALAVMVIGASRLLGYLAEPLNLGLDGLLFSSQLQGNKIAPNTAFNLLIDGLALALVALGVAVGVAQVLVMLAAGVAFIALLGYLFQVPLYGVPGYLPMALNTALCFLLLEMGLLAASAERGVMASLASRLSGGRAARRVLPVAVLLPLGLGWLGTFGARRDLFAPEFAVALVVTFSVMGMVALVLQVAHRLNAGDAAIEHLLSTDTLTGLLNRRTVMEALGVEMASSQRYRHALSTAMIDIDHFKRVNDTYGHAAGDEVLRGLGTLIKATLRETDVAGRYGGEEFIVILPHTDLQGALVYGERLRSRVEQTPIALPSGENLHMTCSIGLAQVFSGEVPPQPEQLVAKADLALYAAKRFGRNRVQTAGP